MSLTDERSARTEVATSAGRIIRRVTKVDVELLNRYKPPHSQLSVDAGCFTNWLGVKTDASLFPSRDALEGRIFGQIPWVNDGVYGRYAEYAAFLTAIDHSLAKTTFTAIELGAGWGPWISAIGKVCQRLGFANVNLIGVEADPEKCRLMGEHMGRNGLTAKIVHAAAWHEDTLLKFPIVPLQDHGAAASVSGEYADPDYRGLAQEYVDVPGYRLRTICNGTSIIDYMHWDIQGAELALAYADPELLNNFTRFLFVGTHSRPIEGGLIEFFFDQKWDVLHENPCHFNFDRHKPSIESMTLADGELFVKNPRLA